MTDKNVQLYDSQENKVFPKTKGSLVENNSGENLGGVQAGAQVNIIEKVKVNGTEISIVNKAVDITIDAQSEYTIAKATTADTGYLATYYLAKGGTQVGEKINIPKDMVVQSGSVKTCTTANTPVSGYKVGDKYIDLVLANADSSHIYILVSDLIDTYTGGNGITITGNSIAIDTTVVATKTDLSGKQDTLTTAQANAVNSGITSTKVSNYDNHLNNTTVHITTAERTAWNNKQGALTTAQLSACNSGITSSKVGTYDGYATTISGKADKATTLAGYGITDGLTFVEIV